jgi:tetratricopeptide (TPR) repeat protein
VILSLALALSGLVRSEPLWPEASQAVFREATRLCSQGRYSKAEALSQQLPGEERDLLHAVVGLSRFEDLHDPQMLRAAKAHVESALGKLDDDTPRQRFWTALALVQKSVVAGKLGENLSAAWSGRKAAQLCQKLRDQGYQSPDIDGILGGYLFWKAQSLGAARSLFGGDTRARGIGLTEAAARSQSPLRDAYRSSLAWMRFEQGRYAEALSICRTALEEFPENRIWRQAEGDMLFRLGRREEALTVYTRSWNEYAGLETLPVNRLSAAGNLGRIHLAMGNTDSARRWIQVFDDPRYRNVRPWLPASLLREVAPVRKRLGLPSP